MCASICRGFRIVESLSLVSSAVDCLFGVTLEIGGVWSSGVVD